MNKPAPYTSRVYIKDLRLHACHGVLEQERVVGNDYVINVTLTYPIEPAATTDSVEQAINYAEVLAIVKEQMSVQSNLLETVAWRMCRELLARFASATHVSLDIMKVAPPMPIDGAGAGISLEMDR